MFLDKLRDSLQAADACHMIVDLGKRRGTSFRFYLPTEFEPLILEAKNFDVWSRKPGFWAVEF